MRRRGPPASRRRARPARVPDFFIVGHQKCGTTALYKMLRRHPQIFLPDVKEPRYFALRPARHAARTRSRRAPARSTLEDTWRCSPTPRPEQRAGEASPQYLRSTRRRARDRRARSRRAHHRDPARAGRLPALVSSADASRNNVEDRARLAQGDRARGRGREGRRIPRGCQHPAALLYSEHVRYVEQLRRFDDAFPREQMLVLIYDDFRRDNDGHVRDGAALSRGRGRGPDEPIETHAPGRAVRFPRCTGSRARERGVRGATPATRDPLTRAVARSPRSLGARPFARRGGGWSTSRRGRPTPQLRGRASPSFKPEVVALSDYLGRDLVTPVGL